MRYELGGKAGVIAQLAELADGGWALWIFWPSGALMHQEWCKSERDARRRARHIIH